MNNCAGGQELNNVPETTVGEELYGSEKFWAKHYRGTTTVGGAHGRAHGHGTPYHRSQPTVGGRIFARVGVQLTFNVRKLALRPALHTLTRHNCAEGQEVDVCARDDSRQGTWNERQWLGDRIIVLLS